MDDRLIGNRWESVFAFSDDDDVGAPPSKAPRTSFPAPSPSPAAPTASPPLTGGGGQGVGSVGVGVVSNGGDAFVGKETLSFSPWSDDEDAPFAAQCSTASASSSSHVAPTAPPPSTVGGGQVAGSLDVDVEYDGRYPAEGEAPLPPLPANCPRLIGFGDDGQFRIAGPDEKVLPAPGTPPLYRASPVSWWTQKLGYRMSEAVHDVERFGGEVEWHLPPSLSLRIKTWTIDHIYDTLAKRAVGLFYIGITHQVGKRWSCPKDGHKVKNGWQRMDICAVSDDSGEIATSEELVISEFRYRGRGGRLVGPRLVDHRFVSGNHLCTNRAKGSESGSHGVPPHCLYVCWLFADG